MRRMSNTGQRNYTYSHVKHASLNVIWIDSPVNDPFERRAGARGSALDIASTRCSDVSQNIQVSEERRVDA